MYAYLLDKVSGGIEDVVRVGEDSWELKKSFTFVVHNNGVITNYVVPKGYRIDCASIPPSILPFFGDRPKKEVMYPSYILHDYMYAKKEYVDRKLTDDIMLALMDRYNEPNTKFKRFLVYQACRLFGENGFVK